MTHCVLYVYADPPHEPKGWYSVYDQDTTVSIIQQAFL